MPFNFERDWPLIAAGGLGIASFVALRSGSKSGYTTMVPSDKAEQAAVQGQEATQAAYSSNLQQALASYLSYESTLNTNATSVEVANIESELQALQGANAIANTQAQGAAYASAIQANKPTFWQQISQFIDSLANAFSSYSSGFNPGIGASSSSGNNGLGSVAEGGSLNPLLNPLVMGDYGIG